MYYRCGADAHSLIFSCEAGWCSVEILTVTHTGDNGWSVGAAWLVSGIYSAPCSIPVDINSISLTWHRGTFFMCSFRGH